MLLATLYCHLHAPTFSCVHLHCLSKVWGSGKGKYIFFSWKLVPSKVFLNTYHSHSYVIQINDIPYLETGYLGLRTDSSAAYFLGWPMGTHFLRSWTLCWLQQASTILALIDIFLKFYLTRINGVLGLSNSNCVFYPY